MYFLMYMKAGLTMMKQLRKCWMNCNWWINLIWTLINQMSLLCRPKAELTMMKQLRKCWMTCHWSRNSNRGYYIPFLFNLDGCHLNVKGFFAFTRMRVVSAVDGYQYRCKFHLSQMVYTSVLMAMYCDTALTWHLVILALDINCLFECYSSVFVLTRL